MPKFDELAKTNQREHQRVSAKGGSKKNPNKGFGSLSKKERSEVSKRAARARWDKVKSKKEAEHGQKSINPTEDRSE